MSLFAKASTRPLLVAAGLDPEVAILFRNRPDEDMATWRAVKAIGDRVRATHGTDVHWGDWPAEPAAIAALQAALADHAGHRRRHDFAWALVHYGLRDAATFAALHPWDRVMFDWQERGLDADRVIELTRAAGFEPLAGSTSRACVDGWIRDPVRAMGCAQSLVGSLFEPCLTGMMLALNCEPPGHAGALRDLARLASPPVDVAASEDCADDEDEYVVDYTVDGEASSFRCTLRDGRPDTHGLLDAFDALMARLGRAERAFEFALPRQDDGACATFVVQDGARFAACNRVLGLPLEPRTAGLAGPR